MFTRGTRFWPMAIWNEIKKTNDGLEESLCCLRCRNEWWLRQRCNGFVFQNHLGKWYVHILCDTLLIYFSTYLQYLHIDIFVFCLFIYVLTSLSIYFLIYLLARYLCTYSRTCVLTYLPTYLPTYLHTYLHTSLPIHLLACLTNRCIASICPQFPLQDRRDRREKREEKRRDKATTGHISGEDGWSKDFGESYCLIVQLIDKEIIYIFTYIYIYMFIYTSMKTCIYMSVYIYIYTNIYIYICIHTYICIYICQSDLTLHVFKARVTW